MSDVAHPFHTGFVAVLRELDGVYDVADVAQWLLSPNPSLEGATPAETAMSEPAKVVDAARMLRYAVQGS